MADRGPYDLFEQWPDDGTDEVAHSEGVTWSVIAVVVCLVALAAVISALVVLVYLAGWLDDKHADDNTDVLGLVTVVRRSFTR